MSEEQYIIDKTLKRAHDIAREQMPAWEGGFAFDVINSIDYLQERVSILESQIKNHDET